MGVKKTGQDKNANTSKAAGTDPAKQKTVPPSADLPADEKAALKAQEIKSAVTPIKKADIKDEPQPVITQNKKAGVKEEPQPVITPNKKTDIKEEPQPVVTPDKKADVKEEPQPVITPNKKTDIKVEPQPVVTPNKKVDVKEEPQPVITPNKKTDIKVEPQPVVTPNKKNDIKEESQPVITPNKKTDIKVEPQPVNTPNKKVDIKEQDGGKIGGTPINKDIGTAGPSNFGNLPAFSLLIDPIADTEKLNDAFPVLLFPLRLETRFRTIGAQKQLWLRVYPDDCNINKKEDTLSESELSGAKAFWVEIWKAGSVEAEERGAWRSLVNSYGSGRSAWIISHYRPLNQKPDKSDATHKILVVTSLIPLTNTERTAARNYWAAVWLAKGNSTSIKNANAALISATSNAKANEIIKNYSPVNLTDDVPGNILDSQVLLKELQWPGDPVTTKTSWTKAPKVFAFPEKFVAITYSKNTKKTFPFPNNVRGNLSVGIDPSANPDQQIKKDGNNDMIVNEDLKWMVDFEKSIEVGMGIKIDLTAQEFAGGFDKVFVVGLRYSVDQIQNKTDLEKLITDYFNSKEGFEILKQGTPTNNTEDTPAGYSWSEDADKSFDRIFSEKEKFKLTIDPASQSDGQVLADTLGIDALVLRQVSNAGGRDQAEARAMNTALFPATLGYFMEEMMTPLFSDSDIDATRSFFVNYVSGRGHIPAIRIGKQPYGILPVSAYSKMKFNPAPIRGGITNLQKPFLQRFHALVMKMDATWDSLVPRVSYIGKESDPDPHQTLLDVIGLHPGSVEFHQRYAQSILQLYNQSVLQNGPASANSIGTAFAAKAKSILQQLGIDAGDAKIPVLEKYFSDHTNILSGPVIDDTPLSEVNGIRAYTTDKKNYIEWLATSDVDKIRLENFGGNPAPSAILYLLLKHALMLTQAGAATEVLVSNKVVTNKKVFYDSDLISVQKSDPGVSKFAHLYNTYPAIVGTNSKKLAEYIYTPAVLKNSAETKRLRETIAALTFLEKTPTARLERLFTEHLDCCNYRIDAWKTGLASYKLTQQRTVNGQQSKGIYLGAYGCLFNVKPGTKQLTNVLLSAGQAAIFNKDGHTPVQKDSSNFGYIHAPSLNQASTAAVLRNTYESHKKSAGANAFEINLNSDRVRVALSFLEGIRNGQSMSALLGYRFEKGLHDNNPNVELDKFIYPLRKAFPLVADNMKDTKSGTDVSIETIEASNVIDGLKLINFIAGSPVKTYPFGLTFLPQANTIAAQAIVKAISGLIDINDAISDLVIAEQVHQVVNSNFDRAAGTAAAFSKGGYPPDMEIVNTPRSGIALTNKFAIQFDATVVADKSPYYDETAKKELLPMTPRAIAEPAINKWLASIFPNPENVLCSITYSSPAMTESAKVYVSQKDLGLQPIDLLYTFNLDTDQAMTELDDRISKYCRYNLGLKQGFESFIHPKTDLSINYTEVIDKKDTTKVSFFELAALVKSIKKIFIGARFLTQGELTVPTANKASSIMDDDQLKRRVMVLNELLVTLNADLKSITDKTISISGIIAGFIKLLPETPAIDATKVTALTSQFQSDLKNYLVTPIDANKNAMVLAFENNISPLVDPAKKTGLTKYYKDSLKPYLDDFAQFDILAKDVIEKFTAIALFDNIQTGTGFINQGISGVYESVFRKLDAVIERWNKKTEDYKEVIDQYDPGGIAEDQVSLLQKAESIISVNAAIPAQPGLSNYKSLIDNKKNSFDTLLINLKSIKTNSKQKLTDFIDNAEGFIKSIGLFDTSSFDSDKGKNDLGPEKLMIALLKEDIAVAMKNMSGFLSAKINSCQQLIDSAGCTVINKDKITALLNAAKKITGEESLILPVFKLDGDQAIEIDKCYQNKDNILSWVTDHEKRIFPVEDWMGGVARVRERIQHWENICSLTNAFNTNAIIELTPLQIPFLPDDRWAAMKFRNEKDPTDTFSIRNDKLLYTAHFATPVNIQNNQCGIVIDEWTELIPANEETTGITFHFDQPNSEPPQTMLLVTPPESTGTWKWNDIVAAIEETFDMAKKRAVEPSQIETTDYAQFLPTTMIAVTLNMLSVSTNLANNNQIYNQIENK